MTEDGSKKSIMSENGEYTMTEDGLTWKEQAEALASALIENQSLSFLNTDAEGKTDAVSGVSISVNGFIDLATKCLEEADAEGKTDAVSGVSISVNGFIDLATKCLEEASGIQASQPETEEAPEEEAASEKTADMAGTEIDAVSGATMSSTAAVTGINEAYDLLQTVK